MKALRWLLLALLLPPAAALWLAGTESGLDWTWRLVRPYLPAAVSVAEVDGRLIGPLTVRGLRVAQADGGLELERLTLDWQPTRLLAGEVRVSNLDIEGLRYVAPSGPAESPPPADGFELPRLPLAVEIANVGVHDLAYASSPAAEPFRVREVALQSLRLDDGGVILNAFEVRDPRLRLDADARLGRGADGAAQARADWRLQPPRRPELTGRARIDGSRRALHVTANLDAPYTATLEADVTGTPAAPAFELALDADQADTAAWLGERPEGLPPTLGLRLTAAGAWADGALRLDRAELVQRHGGARVTAAGRLAVADSDLRLDWTGLRWPLTAGEPVAASPRGSARLRGRPGDWHAVLEAALAPSGTVSGELRLDGERLAGDLEWRDVTAGPVRSPAGEAHFAGRFDDYRVNLRARARHERVGAFEVELAGRGDREHLAVEKLDAGLLDGTLTGHGEIAWRPAPHFRAELNGRGLNPGRLAEAWPGRLNLEIAASGGRPDEYWHAEVSHLAVAGRLRGRDLTLRGAGGWDGRNRSLRLRNLQARSGASRATVDGRLGARWELSWTLASPDLRDLLPGAAGELNGEGTARGRAENLAVSARLRGADLRYRETAAQSLTLDADVDLSGAGPSTLTLRVAGLFAAGRRWDLAVDGGGRPQDHRIELSLRGDGRAADLTLTGEWRAPDWRGRLTAARIDPGLGPVWNLADPAGLDYTGGDLHLDRACLATGDARACLTADAGAGRADGRFDLDALPLALAGLLLPPEVTVDGTLSAAGDFAYAGGAPRLDLEFHTTEVAVHAPRIDDEDALLGVAPGGGRLRLSPEDGELTFDFELRPAGGLSANLTLGPGAALAERDVDGSIQVAMPDLAPFALLSPEVDQLGGQLDGTLRLGGRLGTPSIRGELALTGGRAVLPRPGLTLSDVELRLAGENGALALSGGARSGEGRLTLSGRLRPTPTPDVELRVTGENFRILDTRDARVAVSPDLELTLAGRRVGVRGSVHVPGALITPRDIGAAGAVPVSRDQVIVHGGEPAAPPLTVDAEVRLTLGDDVRVEALGLKADLGGAVSLRQRPGRLATASGELAVIEGEYRAYGQGLQIQTGKLLYSGGPVDNPGLDVRAVRRPREDVTVGVAVRGSLREPDFRLFSEPAMSQTEQLSWLVLGRPLEQTSGGESSALAQAAIGLGLYSGDFLGRRLQDTLGLDTIGVESEAGGPREQAAFVIGKYLSPKLYVSYGIGLFEPVNVLKLRYEISRRWTLLTESGTESGGDITYSIER